MKTTSTPNAGWSRTVYDADTSNATRGPADAPPVIPVAALATALPVAEGVDGMLLASVKAEELSITVATNNEVFARDRFTLLLDGVQHGAVVEIPAGAVPQVVKLPLSAAARTEGAHTLQYNIHALISGDDFPSPIIAMTVDLTKAGGAERLPRPEQFDPRILKGGLTLELLTELGDKVTAHLPAYGGAGMGAMASGDVITPYVGTEPSTPVVVTLSDLDADKIEVKYEKAAIIAAGDGLHDFNYIVTDRAGNVSGPSYGQPIQVVVTSGIADLQPPAVPAYSDDDIILEAEARASVHVTIPAHAKVFKDDEVIVVWGARRQAPAKVPASNASFDVIVPTAEVFAQSPTITPFPVSYDVMRAGALLGQSGPITVAANLETAGGIDPTPETGWNENLKPLTIFGGVDDDGDGDLEANVISVADSKIDAKAVIPWLAVDDATDVFKEDDVITLFWNGVALPVKRTITAADVTKEVDIEMVVPTATIQSGGSGEVIVTYTVGRPVSDVPDFNTALSPDQPVEVKSATGLPGGTAPLAEVVLPEAGILPIGTPPDDDFVYTLNKKLCVGGTPVDIPHYVNKKAGDKIFVSYKATDKLENGADIPASHWETKPAYVVPASEVGTTSSVIIPEANLLAVVLQGNGSVDYNVENEVGTAVAPTTTVWLDNRGKRGAISATAAKP